MGADRVGRVERAVDIVDGDERAIDVEALDAAGRHIGGGADGKGILGHDLSIAVDDVPCFNRAREKCKWGPSGAAGPQPN